MSESSTRPIKSVPPNPAVSLPELPIVGDGEFEIVRELGRGGFGTTYLAIQETGTSRTRECVIKVLHRQYAKDVDHIRRFIRESKALIKLKGSPYVVEFKELKSHSDGSLWLVMEYVEGESLSERLKRHPDGLTIAEAVRFGYQIAHGLSAVHRCKLIHRDVKPSNIMLATDDAGNENLKLIDFGIVYDQSGTRTEFASGTFGYMPPEQAFATDAGHIDKSVDLYALGVTLFEMLTGRLPFRDIGVREWSSGAEPPPILRTDISWTPGLEHIVTELLQSNPNNRPSMASAIAQQLLVVNQNLTATLAQRFVQVREYIDSGHLANARELISGLERITVSPEILTLNGLLAEQEEVAAKTHLIDQIASALIEERFAEARASLIELRHIFGLSTQEMRTALSPAIAGLIDKASADWKGDGSLLITRAIRALRECREALIDLYEWRALSVSLRCFLAWRLNRVVGATAAVYETSLNTHSQNPSRTQLALIGINILSHAARDLTSGKDFTSVLEHIRLRERDHSELPNLLHRVTTLMQDRIAAIVEQCVASLRGHAPSKAPHLLYRRWQIVGPDTVLCGFLDHCYVLAVTSDVTVSQASLCVGAFEHVNTLRDTLQLRRAEFSRLSGYTPPLCDAEIDVQILHLSLSAANYDGLSALQYVRYSGLAWLVEQCKLEIHTVCHPDYRPVLRPSNLNETEVLKSRVSEAGRLHRALRRAEARAREASRRLAIEEWRVREFAKSEGLLVESAHVPEEAQSQQADLSQRRSRVDEALRTAERLVKGLRPRIVKGSL